MHAQRGILRGGVGRGGRRADRRKAQRSMLAWESAGGAAGRGSAGRGACQDFMYKLQDLEGRWAALRRSGAHVIDLEAPRLRRRRRAGEPGSARVPAHAARPARCLARSPARACAKPHACQRAMGGDVRSSMHVPRVSRRPRVIMKSRRVSGSRCSTERADGPLHGSGAVPPHVLPGEGGSGRAASSGRGESPRPPSSRAACARRARPRGRTTRRPAATTTTTTARRPQATLTERPAGGAHGGSIRGTSCHREHAHARFACVSRAAIACAGQRGTMGRVPSAGARRARCRRARARRAIRSALRPDRPQACRATSDQSHGGAARRLYGRGGRGACFFSSRASRWMKGPVRRACRRIVLRHSVLVLHQCRRSQTCPRSPSLVRRSPSGPRPPNILARAMQPAGREGARWDEERWSRAGMRWFCSSPPAKGHGCTF
jgi:hypothetical protein